MLSVQRAVFLTIARRSGSTLAPDYGKLIGKREVVGFGFNGQPSYEDRPDFPFPAIRFKEEINDIKILREKEKGDWKNLTIAEKKALYRASFCQTLVEAGHPTREWKSVIGWGLVFLSLGIWLQIYVKLFVYSPDDLPVTVTEEARQLQLKRMLAFRIEPVDGLSSKFDFEKNDWKK